MNRWNAKMIWGLVFILFGLALAGRELGFITFRIFFPGWWTLFIIIPCIKSIIQRTNGMITHIGLGAGLLLLLSAQGFTSWEIFGTLFIAIILFVVGVSLILKKPEHNQSRAEYSEHVNKETSYNNFSDKKDEYAKEYTNYDDENGNEKDVTKEQGNTNQSNHDGGLYTAFFSTNNYQYVNEEFKGATVKSIFGNVQLDLRNAIIYEESVIDVTCILGGIDIYVPANIRIINQCTAILAGVDTNVMSPKNGSDNSYTIYIKGNCLLGGIEIK